MTRDELKDKIKRQIRVCEKQIVDYEHKGYTDLEFDIEYNDIAWEQYMINNKLYNLCIKEIEKLEQEIINLKN